MKKRIFIAYTISENLKKNIKEWTKELHEFPIRFVPEENLHITIIPPWHEDNIELVQEKLRNLQKPQSFFLTLSSVTIGPEGKTPWVFWIRSKPSEEMNVLKTKLENHLQLVAEKRDYFPHITLARFTKDKYEQFPKKEFKKHIQFQEEINQFSLVESIFSLEGSSYSILETFKLYNPVDNSNEINRK